LLKEKKEDEDLTMTKIRILRRTLFEHLVVGGNRKVGIENDYGFMFHCQNIKTGDHSKMAARGRKQKASLL
jgi:hypothetical protein